MSASTTTKSTRKANRAASLRILDRMLKPGMTVFTRNLHVSRSGMMRHISVLVQQDGELIDITEEVGDVLDYGMAEDGGLRVGGAGMDMGFHVVYGLSRSLFGTEGNPFLCMGKGCPSNDHSNDYGDLARKYDREHAEESEALWNGEGMTPETYRARRSAYVSARQAWIAGQESDLYAPTRKHSDGGYALRQSWVS